MYLVDPALVSAKEENSDAFVQNYPGLGVDKKKNMAGNKVYLFFCLVFCERFLVSVLSGGSSSD